MWTLEYCALVGDYGSSQALSDDQYRLFEPFIPVAKPGDRPRTTDPRRLLDGLFPLVRTGCQWRNLLPPPAFPLWSKVNGRKRHIAADTQGLLFGVLVHAASIQDAEDEGNLLRRIKPLYCWLQVSTWRGPPGRKPLGLRQPRLL